MTIGVWVWGGGSADQGISNWAHKLWSYIQWVSPRIGDYGIMGQLHPVVIWFDAWWLLIDKLGFVGFLYQLNTHTYLTDQCIIQYVVILTLCCNEQALLTIYCKKPVFFHDVKYWHQ